MICKGHLFGNLIVLLPVGWEFCNQFVGLRNIESSVVAPQGVYIYAGGLVCA